MRPTNFKRLLRSCGYLLDYIFWHNFIIFDFNFDERIQKKLWNWSINKRDKGGLDVIYGRNTLNKNKVNQTDLIFYQT